MTNPQQLAEQVRDALIIIKNPPDSRYVSATGSINAMILIASQALPAAEELVRQMSWQPIESAPNMGVFVVRNSDGTCWMHDKEDGYTDWLETYFLGYTPTHWMPLPQPPQPDEGKL